MSWRRKAFYAIVACFTLWITLEIILRVFGYGRFIIYEPDSELLWRPRPNQVGKTVVGRLPITINDQGLRYRVDLESRNPQERRIVAFGDSVTMGWGVDDESHYSAVLERHLVESFPSVQFRVVSAGVNAYPIATCVRRFRRMLVRGDQIDTAILAYSFNTGFERLAHLDEEGRKGILRRVQLKSVVRRSAVYNLVIEDWLRNAVYYRVRQRLMAGSWAAGEEFHENNLADYNDDLEIMRLEAERRGTRLVFLLLGSKDQRGELSEYQGAFLKFARHHDIPVINMVDRFKSLNHDALFMDHVHPSEEGHYLIAQSLFSYRSALTSEDVRSPLGSDSPDFDSGAADSPVLEKAERLDSTSCE